MRKHAALPEPVDDITVQEGLCKQNLNCLIRCVPSEMGADEIRAFLSHLAVHDRVAASTQNAALNALLFLYRHVLKQDFPDLGAIERAKRPRRVPTVFNRDEVMAILGHLKGMNHLMASLLYGAGLRLMECVRLRERLTARCAGLSAAWTCYLGWVTVEGGGFSLRQGLGTARRENRGALVIGTCDR